MKNRFLFIFLALWWGATGWSQSNELAGTFSVQSATGADPTPTVTGFFNSTVGFLPNSVDTGDILLVRQVFSANHRRKLYRITGVTGNSPLVLNVTLIEGTSGGPFPAGTHEILRRTAKGALLDVPNVSQEVESYTYNYNVQHFEDADIDTIIERNDSNLVVLNDGTEFYAGPNASTAIDTSYQVGDSIFVVAGGDTIFTGIAYANPEIDTIYNDGVNYYLATTEGDTFAIGAVAQVVANGVHPTDPPTYLIHIDTLGADTVYFDNGTVWERFSVGGSSIGSPFFTATSATYTSFLPAGVPPIGSFIWNPYIGTLVRKTGVASYSNIGGINGRNVPFGYTYDAVDTLSNWPAQVYAKAMIGVDLSTSGIVDNPIDITSIPIGGVVSIIINNNTADSKDVVFGDRYINFDGTQLGTVFIETLEWRAFEFAAIFGSGFSVSLQLMNSRSSGSGGTTYTFSDSANGIDLNESSGTVTVALDVTEMTYAAPVGADSIAFWDSSANAMRRMSVSDVVALASAGTTTVTDQANGMDITLTGSDITIAPDITELANTVVASGDSVMVWDTDLNQHRRVSALSIAALTSGAVTGVNDQVNGLDITLNGTAVEVANDYAEVPVASGYNSLDNFLVRRFASGDYEAYTLSGLSDGYMDLISNQTAAGIKKFSVGLQWGTGTMPSGIPFGSANQTVFGLKGGVTAFLAESVWQDYGGLVIENNWNSGTGFQTTRMIATGNDSGNDGSYFEIWTRPNGSSQNAVMNARFAASSSTFPLTLFGASTGAGNGIINVPVGGIGWDGGGSNYNLSPTSGGGLKLYENGNVNVELSLGQNGWVDGSDSLLKHDIVPISLTPAQIRAFRAYTYKLNVSDSTQIGVIANHFVADFPEALADENADTLGVYYSSVAALALGATARLQAQIDSMARDSVKTEVSTTTTATLGAWLPVNTDGAVAGVAINVPNPVAGDWFGVVDSGSNAATFNITVDFTAAGDKFHRQTANYVINADSGSARFTYVSSAVGWVKLN